MPTDGTKGKPGPKPGGKRPEGAGRKKGTLNKRTEWGAEIADILKGLDCCPFTGMAMIGMGKLACYVCHGEKEVVAFGAKPDSSEPIDKTECQNCYGTGFQPIDPGVRGRAYSELAQYLAPKRKAIEQTNKTLVGVVIKDYTGAGSGLVLEAQETETINMGIDTIKVHTD